MDNAITNPNGVQSATVRAALGVMTCSDGSHEPSKSISILPGDISHATHKQLARFNNSFSMGDITRKEIS